MASQEGGEAGRLSEDRSIPFAAVDAAMEAAWNEICPGGINTCVVFIEDTSQLRLHDEVRFGDDPQKLEIVDICGKAVRLRIVPPTIEYDTCTYPTTKLPARTAPVYGPARRKGKGKIARWS